MLRLSPLIIGLMISCRTDKSITVQNPAPKADIFSHSDGDVVLEGFATTFVGSVTDANHTPDPLTTIWYLDGDVVCDDVGVDDLVVVALEVGVVVSDDVCDVVGDVVGVDVTDVVIVVVGVVKQARKSSRSPTNDGFATASSLLHPSASTSSTESAILRNKSLSVFDPKLTASRVTCSLFKRASFSERSSTPGSSAGTNVSPSLIVTIITGAA